MSVRRTCNVDPPGKNMSVRRTDRPSWKKICLFNEQIDPFGNLKNRLGGCFCNIEKYKLPIGNHCDFIESFDGFNVFITFVIHVLKS